jgi:predicted tellurium resistance membrane protein TerC
MSSGGSCGARASDVADHGLIISIPLIVFGSALILRIMDRFPILVTLGAGLIGYVAGEMLVDEPVVESWLPASEALLSYGVPFAGALLVMGTALLL